MIIESIELQNYRNYELLNLKFDERTNILYGDNAQGKTNILEALYVCATTRSHRGSKDKEIIAFENDESHIKLMVRKKEVLYRIDMHLKKNKTKGIAINSIPIRKAVELFGIINVIFFSPEDLNIIKNGPSERRRFMDMELSQLDKIYLHNLIQYNKVLLQRNKLLKELSFNMQNMETLDVWDMQLIHYGKEIIKRRVEFIEQLNSILPEIHNKLTGNKEDLKLKYMPCVSEARFESEVSSSREKDLKLKATNVGPHKDDIHFYIKENDIKKYGSQGQQRTAALSLKLAEIQLVEKRIHEKPVLLLDDVLSELDNSRQNFLLNSIGDIQTVITCTGLDEFIGSNFQMNKVYEVIEGQVFNLDKDKTNSQFD